MKKKSFTLFIAIVTGWILHAQPLIAAGHGNVVSDAWTGVETLELFPAPESAHVNIPTRLTPVRETKIMLYLTMPFGCFRTDVQVHHRDDHTHVLTPVVSPGGASCVPSARYAVHEVNLGILTPGKHELTVEGVAKASEPVQFEVPEGAEIVSH